MTGTLSVLSQVPGYGWVAGAVAVWVACGMIGLGISLPNSFRDCPSTAANAYEKKRAIFPAFILLGPVMFIVAACLCRDLGYSGFVLGQTPAMRKARAIQEYAGRHGNKAVEANWKEVWASA